MRLLLKSLAAMLLGLALTAYYSNLDAQSRSRSSSSSSRSSSTRSYSRGSTSSKPQNDAVRPSSTTSRSSSSGRSSGTVTRPSTTSRPSGQPTATRPSTNGRPSGQPAARPDNRPDKRPDAKPSHGNHSRPSGPDFKPGNHHKPVTVRRPGHHVDRKHPSHRSFMHYSKPSYHWASCNHYYGYRVRVLPMHAHRHVYRGVTYYCYNDIWYRPYGGYYVVSRPPFGTSLAAELIADMAWTAVSLSYYNTVANTYSQINENNEYIAQPKAYEAYSLANELGLVQSFAAADASYFYQDGVFYTMDSNGQYSVIVPPAGALVENLPEDYQTVTLGGNEYYKVDNTIYRTTISDGKPYFEVVGQM